jgi:hypothetical protein
MERDGKVSNSKMKAFIIENSQHLDRNIKIQIMKLIAVRIGADTITDTGKEYVSINLNRCEQLDPGLIKSIYDIVFSYINILNTPLVL